MQRIIVVYNPRSSQFRRVQAEILGPIVSQKGHMIGKYAIKKTTFEDNLQTLAALIKDDDLIISAGGDATAAISANAIMKSNKDATLAVLPYGNFNDLSRTLRTFRLQDILRPGATTKNLHPLSIYVDGKFWRHSTSYVTIGMTAEAVEIFDQVKIRRYLQKGHRSSWRSYFFLASWYFKNRHKKLFIPDFKLNGVPKHRKTSDYMAVNGHFISHIMKGGDDYLKPRTFRSGTNRLTSFFRLSVFMAKSIFNRIPGTDTTGDVLEFITPSSVTIQAEGEYHIFKNVHTIEIKKDARSLKVIHN